MTRAEVEQIQQMCECRPTEKKVRGEAGGRMRLTARMGGNSCIFFTIEAAGAGRIEEPGE
jgi:hypothetical protein